MDKVDTKKIDSIINCKNHEEADCVFLTANYDRTSSLGKGAEKGGQAIIKCLEEDIEFLDRYTLRETGYEFKISQLDLGVSNEMLPEKMMEKVSSEYSNLIKNDRLLFLLGGDHSVSIGALDAISKKINPNDTTILQIDAHCDLRDSDANANPDQSHVSKYAHCCVMRRAFDLGFNIVQVGVRSYAKEEYDFFQDHSDKIKVFEWGKGENPAIDEIIKSIKTENIYISIDVDGIDPAHLPSTGTPIPGGLEWYYAVNLLRRLVQEKNAVGFDLVEVIPKKDEVQTQFGAAQLCYNIISTQLFKK
jgi:agmatinase